jgi:type I restriction enzyme S subunit
MLLSNLDLLATAPGGVARLRELILTLAVQGKLVPQDPADEPAGELLKKIRAEKDRLIAEGKIRRDKPLAAIAEGEKPFGLPVGWEWVRLGALLPFRIGKTPPSKDPQYWADAGHAWVSISDMNHFGEVFETGRKITDRGAGVFGYDLLPSGTLIMSFKLTIGKISVLRVPAYHNEAIVSFTPLSGLDSGFLKYMLPTVAKTGASKDALMGATLNTESLSNLVIALPPHSEQSRIVTRVEMLMRLCDALEAKGRLEAAQHTQLVSTLLGTLTVSTTPEELAANWQRVAQHFDLLLDRPEAIDALEQTLLQLAVRGLLVPQDPTDEPASALLQKIRAEKDRLIATGQIKRDKPLPPITDEEKPFELPVGWEWVRMGAVVNASEAGWSPTCIGSPRRPGLWGVLKVSAVSWGEFDANANKELPSDLVPRPEYEVRDGDFLLSRANTAELVARSVVVEQAEPKLMLSDKIIRLAVSSQMNRSFLNMANNASYAREHYAVNASGTSSSMKNVSREVVLALPVPLPPLAEQSRIVTRVTALRRLCADLRQRLAERQSVQVRLVEALVANNAQTSTQQEDECHAA